LGRLNGLDRRNRLNRLRGLGLGLLDPNLLGHRLLGHRGLGHRLLGHCGLGHRLLGLDNLFRLLCRLGGCLLRDGLDSWLRLRRLRPPRGAGLRRDLAQLRTGQGRGVLGRRVEVLGAGRRRARVAGGGCGPGGSG
ncbi:hypothetical protein G3I47_21640, partial [Streptomyces anulatus]|uniref:hypothetical protein n=1 Tax=Streptomyces anulatus TaxID=1892 RepID=UPI0013B67193